MHVKHKGMIIAAILIITSGLLLLHSRRDGHSGPITFSINSTPPTAAATAAADIRQQAIQETFGDRWIVFTSISYPTEAVKKVQFLLLHSNRA